MHQPPKFLSYNLTMRPFVLECGVDMMPGTKSVVWFPQLVPVSFVHVGGTRDDHPKTFRKPALLKLTAPLSP